MRDPQARLWRKTFDQVDWVFLEKILVCRNFDSRWISWIMGCVQDPRFSIFISGRPRGRIFSTRGIKQGDLLSSFLFLLISKVLSVLLVMLHVNGLFEGFIMGKDRIHASILQFATKCLRS